MPTVTPAAQGYSMPAEWAPHAATWLAWPHRHDDWPGRFRPIPWVYGRIVARLALHERVAILVNDTDHRRGAERVLRAEGVNLGNVEFHLFPTDRVWVRDSGPIFVVDGGGGRGLLDWHFNAWAKYDDWTHDDQIPAMVHSLRGLPSWQPHVDGRRLVLEGGSIDVDGEGTLLTTEECLLSDVQARNPGLTRGDLENAFADYLAARKVIWLGRGIVGDDTHGHVDDLARFVAPATVVLASEADPHDENYEAMQENRERLQGATDASGRTLTVVPLPLPRPVVFKGQRLPASYANFYVANGLVLVPTFDDPVDRQALGLLAELMPDREVVGIHSADLIWGLGALHCMTQQEPA